MSALPETPQLSIQLLESSIDFLIGDSSALKSTALVSRALLHRSRTHLFSCIILISTLSFRSDGLTRTLRFVKLLKQQPVLATYVRELYLRIGPVEADSAQFHQTLTMLKDLTSLKVYGVPNFRSFQVYSMQGIMTSIAKMIQLPSMRVLGVEFGVIGFPLSIIRGSNLKILSLKCGAISLQIPHYLDALLRDSASSVELRHFVIGGNQLDGQQLTSLLSEDVEGRPPVLSINGLEELSTHFVNAPVLASLSTLSQFNAISHLSLEFRDSFTSRNADNHFEASSIIPFLITVQHLTISYTIDYVSKEVNGVEVLVTTLQREFALMDNHQLLHVDLKLEILLSGRYEAPVGEYWSTLAGLFLEERWASLKAVSLSIEVRQPRPESLELITQQYSDLPKTWLKVLEGSNKLHLSYSCQIVPLAI